MDFLSAAPSSANMTPRAVFPVYQPAMSVSRIEERMADTVLLRTLSPSPFWGGFPRSSNISTKNLRDRSARFRSRQSARRNIGSGRRPFTKGWFSLAFENKRLIVERPLPSKTGAILSNYLHFSETLLSPEN